MTRRVATLLLLSAAMFAQTGIVVGGGDVIIDPKTGEHVSCLEKPDNPRQANLCWSGFPPFDVDEFHAAAEFKACDKITTVGWELLTFNPHTGEVSAPKTRPAKACSYALWMYSGRSFLVYEGLRSIKKPLPKELR